MSSCAASCCTCFPKASCVFATSVSWPTGNAPPSCRFVFNCWAQHNSPQPNKTCHPPVTHLTFGAVPSVVHRWWSSKDSPQTKSNFALHPRSRLPHDTTLSSSNPFRVAARYVSLRLNAQQNSSPSFPRTPATILSRTRQLPNSSAVLSRTVSPTLHTAVPAHSIPIGHASAATTGGSLLTA